MALQIETNVPLAPLTTIKLGGSARYFVRCESAADLIEALTYAKDNHLPLHILGEGSNTIFLDKGFAGLVLKVDLQGIAWQADGAVTVAAGEPWEPFVEECVARNLAGLECLSGIPGSAGATPIQNVGAYGQEIADTLVEVVVFDQETLKEVRFAKAECAFGYRTSRFKRGADAGRYIVTEITLQLKPGGAAQAAYGQVAAALQGANYPPDKGDSGGYSLTDVRNVVLTLRRGKSMVIDESDPNTRSCGSFFENLTFSAPALSALQAKGVAAGIEEPVPTFLEGATTRVPTAWLIEKAGFPKGYRLGGVGVSPNHNLALVNYAGTTAELLTLAKTIQAAVQEKFGVAIRPEPVVVS